MSKKVISTLLSAAMLVGTLCVGAGAVTASAADSNTYYFLAPDNFFKSEAGAVNDKVGVYWWQPSENAAWPGAEMTAAPEIGENVFKVEGVGADTTTIIFNAFVDAGNPADPELAKVAHQTVNINTEGYDGDAPYDDSLTTDDFNGWIYVLDCNAKDVNEFSQAETTGGAWFQLDNYKDNTQYYGSYGFGAEATTDSETTAEATTDSETTAETTTDTDAAPAAEGQAIKAGETITVQVTVGDVKIEGEAAKLGAYNYDVNYNADVLEYDAANSKDETTGGMPLVNANTAGTIKLATMAALGLNEDFSGEKAPVYTLTFKTTKDTTEGELGLTGKCTSLTAVSADGSKTETLIGVNNPDDSLTALKITLPVVEEPSSEEPSSSEPSSTTPSSSKVVPSSSKPASSSSASSKATGDTPSSSSKAASTAAANTAKTTTATTTAATPVQTAGTFAVVSLVVILMAAAAVVLYTRKKTEE